MNKPDIKFRDPSTVMKLSRLGSFHQSKLSFLRSFIREFKDETWCEYSIEGYVFWIHTAYSEKDTIKRWAEIIHIAKDYGCKKIQFTTQRDPKLWEKRFGFKPIAYKMEYAL